MIQLSLLLAQGFPHCARRNPSQASNHHACSKRAERRSSPAPRRQYFQIARPCTCQGCGLRESLAQIRRQAAQGGAHQRKLNRSRRPTGIPQNPATKDCNPSYSRRKYRDSFLMTRVILSHYGRKRKCHSEKMSEYNTK